MPLVVFKAGRTAPVAEERRRIPRHCLGRRGGRRLSPPGGRHTRRVHRGSARLRHGLGLATAFPGTPRGHRDQRRWLRGVAADACENNGLLVPELGEAAMAALRSLLPLEASVANPVDMIASATARQYGDVVEPRVLARR